VFERSVELLDDYYRLMDQSGDSAFNRPAATEVRKRLAQLDRLLELVREEDAVVDAARNRMGEAIERRMADQRAAGKSWTDPHPPGENLDRADGQVSIDALDDLQLFTEAFYYLAERVRTILKQDKPPLLPGLGDPGFLGVSQVRNRLLEHYLPDGRLIVGDSFATGATRGPVLKAVSQDGIAPAIRDAGLYVNAEEFAKRLERQLESAIARAKKP
jgi:hypothetical protein